MDALEFGKVMERFGQEFLRACKNELQQFPKLLEPYYMEHIHQNQNLQSAAAARVEKAKGGKRPSGQSKGLRNKKNTTNELYRLYGKLIRALSKGGDGNISKVGNFDIEVGIDLGTVPYARIHEYGGVAGRGARIPKRPYMRPALDDFKKNEIDDAVTRAFESARKHI